MRPVFLKSDQAKEEKRMLKETELNRIIHSAGIEDASMIRLDVLSVYLLHGLQQAGMLDHMCFKGGNSLRKIFARRPTRFSRDLDFVDASYQQLGDGSLSAEDYYLKLLEAFDQQTLFDINWRIKELSTDEIKGETLRVDLHFFLFGERPGADWERKSENVLAFECSFRRPILLPPEHKELRQESWFNNLEFTPAPVPVLQLEECAAEKVRASFQRSNPRDIFDLHQYGELPFNKELVRTMAILKCWQDRGIYDGPKNFDADEFFDKLNVENYSWDKLKLQVSDHAWIEPKKLLDEIRERYAFLNDISTEELELCKDKWKKSPALHDKLWHNCKELHVSTSH